MADTKRGRERSDGEATPAPAPRDRGRPRGASRGRPDDVRDAHGRELHRPPDEEPIRLECWGFEELGYGVVLYDEADEELASLSHESVVAIEPA